jgi:hypothetical protein
MRAFVGNQATKGTNFTIGPVEPALEFTVLVYAYNGLGVRSTAITGNVTTVLDTTPKLPSIYQIDTDSTVEPTLAQFTTAAGRNPKEGDIVIGTDTTVTPNKTYAWSYNLSSTDWTSNANFISGDLIVDGSITGDQITANSITTNKLTGDVTEVYPIEWPITGLYAAFDVTAFQEFSIPAPKLGIVKRQKVEMQLELLLENNTASSVYNGYIAGIEMKSKSATGNAVGTVTYVSAPNSSRSIWSFVGNVIENIDTRGSVADSSTGANGTAFIDGVRYDATADKTYIQIDESSSFFTTGDTAYYSPSSFASVGTWTTQGVFEIQYVGINAYANQTLAIHFIKSFGQSDTSTDLRLFVFSAMDYRGIEFRGTMENVS